MIGDENFQNFRGDGGYDTYTGGLGKDTFRIEYDDTYVPAQNDMVMIDQYVTDFEEVDEISIEDYGFSEMLHYLQDNFQLNKILIKIKLLYLLMQIKPQLKICLQLKVSFT